MGRQTRTLPKNEGQAFTGTPTTGATVVNIPSYGYTLIPKSTAESYVLDAPTEGCRKILASVTSTSVASIIRMSTGTSVKVGNQAATQITFNATVDQCVELLGLNSTRWIVVSASPETAAVNSTGIVIGTS